MKLCEHGAKLWDDLSNIDIFTEKGEKNYVMQYKDYQRHLVNCKECQKLLGCNKDDIRLLKEVLEIDVKSGSC